MEISTLLYDMRYIMNIITNRLNAKDTIITT